MTYQFSPSAPTSLGMFVQTCESVILRDWRRFCQDGLFGLIQIQVGQNWNEGGQRYYTAVVGGGDPLYEYRLPSEMEVGGAQGQCDYTTVDTTPAVSCQIKLPMFELLRVGLPEHDEEKWREMFCKAHPASTMKHSPFTRVNGALMLDVRENDSEDKILFASWLVSQLMLSVGRHLAYTILHGRKELADQFDGFYTLLDNGLEVEGTCPDYPLKPATIDFGYLVTGIVGASAHPASTVPAGTPPLILFPGTMLETVFPVAGYDLIDIEGMWTRNVISASNGFITNGWVLVTGKDETECLTRLASCKKVCSGDCATVFMSPPESVAVEAANMINGKWLKFWPSMEMVPLVESPSMGARGEHLLMPTAVQDGDGFIPLWSVVFENMEAALQPQFDALAPARIADRYAFGLPEDPYMFLHQTPDAKGVMEMLPDAVFSIVPVATKPFCYAVATSSKAVMVLERPETMLRVTGIACNSQPRVKCPPDMPVMSDVAACQNGVAGQGFNSAISFTADPMLTFDAGDTVYVQATYGNTYVGVVRTYDAETGDMVVDFVESGITCTSGGGIDGGYISGTGSKTSITRYVKACDGAASPDFEITFDTDALVTAQAGDAVAIKAALGSVTYYGVIASVDDAGPTNAVLTVTLSAPLPIPADCNWETTGAGTDVPVTAGGTITIVF